MSEKKLPPEFQHTDQNSTEQQPGHRALTRRDFVKIAGAGTAAVAGGLIPSALSAAPKPAYDTLTLTCYQVTDHTIFLKVCAGPSGAPSGFSIQWVRHSDYPGLGCNSTIGAWPDDTATNFCKGSFSGSPGCSSFNLTANGCVIIEIGNLDDSVCGVSLDGCGSAELDPCTEYVFRGFAHGDSTHNRSAFSLNSCCTTSCAELQQCCTKTQGYWKTHPCEWPSPFVPGANGTADSDPQCALTSDPNEQCACDSVNTILVGSHPYTQCDLLCALDRKAGGNALVILAHQLITAKLNLSAPCYSQGCGDVLIGNTTLNELITSGDQLIGALDILKDSVAANTTLGGSMTGLASTLDLWNNSNECSRCTS